MSDLLCVPCRPGWQVGISERRKLCRPRRCIAATGSGPHSASWKLAATGAWGAGTLETRRHGGNGERARRVNASPATVSL
jgi:hypothetical protein